MNSDVLDEDVEQVPHMAALIFDAIERKEMALKPRVKVKAPSRAIFLGKDFEEVSEASGKVKVKPKRKHGQTRNQQYASANRKKWKAAK
jgi:hypothetical protein